MSKIADDFTNQVTALFEGFEDISYNTLSALTDEMDMFIRTLSIEEQIVVAKYFKQFTQFIIDEELDSGFEEDESGSDEE
jgi:hypothetical protein